jgi:regulator of RNase E activity RraA
LPLFSSGSSAIKKPRGRVLNSKITAWAAGSIVAACCIACIGVATFGQTAVAPPDYEHNQSALLDAFRQVEVASVSDAMEQVLHEKRYLSHRMQAIFPTKFVGTALTVQLVKQENNDPHALDGMLAAIDGGHKDDVYVMQVEDGQDIAGMGGLMGTAMRARGFAGAVIDGGVRDLPQLRRIGFPVYATGVVPSTSVGHYRFGGVNTPVRCDGVQVQPGDIISADQDGVVVIPRARAVEILERAQKLDYTEHAMYPVIEKLRSIVEAVKQFGRI